MCIHTLLATKSGLSSESVKKSSSVNHEFDRTKTVALVTESILENLPTATTDPKNFLKVNKEFVTELCRKKDPSAELLKYCSSTCPRCSEKLTKWAHKTKESFLVSIGELKKVIIPVKKCGNCNILVYPNLYFVGLGKDSKNM